MKLIRTLLAAVLAILVLVSSSNFMVGIHMCMGQVQNVALFTKAEGCEMEKSQPPCHRHVKAPCCDDKTVVHKGDDLKASSLSLQYNASFAVAGDGQAFFLQAEIIPQAPTSRTQFYNYDPPLRSCDRVIQHQVFLI
jgi:hypothetical protein